jgi:hypothetical protein
MFCVLAAEAPAPGEDLQGIAVPSERRQKLADFGRNPQFGAVGTVIYWMQVPDLHVRNGCIDQTRRAS